MRGRSFAAAVVFAGLVVCTSLRSASAGTLSGSFANVPANAVVNLSTNGPLDWVHWGLYTESSLNRKAGVLPQIGDFTELSGGGTNAFVFVYQFSDLAHSYSWTDGVPENQVQDTHTGVWAYGLPTIGTGFEFFVPADTTLRTLTVYLGLYAGRGEMEASLSDGSAPDYSNASLTAMMGSANRVYTFDFAADSPGQTLRIRWRLQQGFRPDANVTLQAATLALPGGNNPPSVQITEPASNTNIPIGSMISLAAIANDFDGSVTRVEFFADGNKIGEDFTSPYSTIWNPAAAGRYNLTAEATDNGGATQATLPVEIFVHGTGGTLSSAVATPPAQLNLTTEGVLDWVHWGLNSSSSFNRKSGAALLPNFTKLGSHPVMQYSNNFTHYSWSDGTPVASASDTPTGVFIIGRDSGFALSVPADTAPRRLKLYVGGYGMRASFQAWLDDFSAAAYTDTSVSNVFDDSYAVYTVDFAAASPGHSLQVQYRVDTMFDGDFGNVTLQAVTLVGDNDATNAPPVVALTYPTNNAVFPAQANIVITANASDVDGTVAKVEFFSGVTKLGEDTSSPYGLAWDNVSAGSYSLTAKATDNSGATTTSAAVNITVDNSSAPPTVSITNPTNTAVFVAPADLNIETIASDSDGSIAKVEFFSGATKLGEDAISPYSFAWNNVPAGSYSVTARATDDFGLSATSAPVNVTLIAPPVAVTLLNARWVEGDFAFSFVSEGGAAYAVEYSPSLAPANWQVLTNLAGTGATLDVTNKAPAPSTGFYRVKSH